MKTREQKQQELDVLANEFRQSPNVFLLSFEGLSVERDWALRRKLRERDGGTITYRVVKNRLAQQAARGTPVEPLTEHFRGMTAVALSPDDPVMLAKILTEFARENHALQIKAGIVEGRVVVPADIEAIAKMLGRSEILAQITALIGLPAQRLVGVIHGVTRNLVVVLGQIRDQQAEAAGGGS